MIIHAASFVPLSDVLGRFDIPNEIFDNFPAAPLVAAHTLISTHNFWEICWKSDVGIPFSWYEFSTGLGNAEYIDMES